MSDLDKHAPRAYNVQIWCEDGVWIADCPALRSCTTFGETYELAVENIRDAIRVALDDLRVSGEPIPADDAPPGTIAIAV